MMKKSVHNPRKTIFRRCLRSSKWLPLALLLGAMGGSLARSNETPVAASKPPATLDPDVTKPKIQNFLRPPKRRYVPSPPPSRPTAW